MPMGHLEREPGRCWFQPAQASEDRARDSTECSACAGRCGAHQGHRIVEKKENTLLGNVHAIAFASANPDLQSKLQRGLLDSLESSLYARGVPNEEHQRLNRLTVMHTLGRRTQCVVGDPDNNTVSDSSLGNDIEMFLKMWNGDWSQPRPQHICCGCCDGEVDARSKLFSTAIAVDLLQSREVDIPCSDDWGKFGMAFGKTAC